MAPKWAAWEASNATKAWKTPRESKRARAPKKAKDGTLVVLPKKKSRPQPRAASAAPDPAMPAPPAPEPPAPAPPVAAAPAPVPPPPDAPARARAPRRRRAAVEDTTPSPPPSTLSRRVPATLAELIAERQKKPWLVMVPPEEAWPIRGNALVEARIQHHDVKRLVDAGVRTVLEQTLRFIDHLGELIQKQLAKKIPKPKQTPDWAAFEIRTSPRGKEVVVDATVAKMMKKLIKIAGFSDIDSADGMTFTALFPEAPARLFGSATTVSGADYLTRVWHAPGCRSAHGVAEAQVYALAKDMSIAHDEDGDLYPAYHLRRLIDAAVARVDDDDDADELDLDRRLDAHAAVELEKPFVIVLKEVKYPNTPVVKHVVVDVRCSWNGRARRGGRGGPAARIFAQVN